MFVAYIVTLVKGLILFDLFEFVRDGQFVMVVKKRALRTDEQDSAL